MKIQIKKYPFLILMLLTSGIALCTSDEIGFPGMRERIEQIIEQQKIRSDADTDRTIVGETGVQESEDDEEKHKEPNGIESASKGEEAERETILPEQKIDGSQEEVESSGQVADAADKNENSGKLNQDLTENAGKMQDGEKGTEKKNGITRFEFYEPLDIESYYYSDAGKTALTTEYDYETVDDSYFADAAFIGDSRTLGIYDYAEIDQADFFCESSMTVFKVMEDSGVMDQRAGKKVDLKIILQQKQYGKIYIMLGINELGYGNTQMYLKQFREMVQQIRVWQPDAIIYLMANLHISEDKNNMATEFNNVNINDKNAAIATLANGVDIFYLDANPLFTDENGFLKADLTFDGVHLYAQHYDVWKTFLMEHAVVKEPPEQMDNYTKNHAAG